MLIEPALLQDKIIPSLSASWHERSFVPCVELCSQLTSAAQSFAAKYHTGSAEPFLNLVARGIQFDRDYWQLLVGEILLFAADEIPEIQVSPTTLCYLLAPDFDTELMTPRIAWPWIRQAHLGTRDLRFGIKVFRSEFCGYNDLKDVHRLSGLLKSISPAAWRPEDLLGCPTIDAEDAEEEVELLREWFPQLQDLYAHAEKRHRTMVCEVL